MRSYKLTIGLSALALTACNSIELGYVPLFVPTPSLGMNTCSFDPASAPLLSVNLDTFYRSRLSMAVAVRNVLDPVTVIVDPAQASDQLNYPRVITPLRFDFRWECESQGFLGDVGALTLPAFSADLNKPFCINTRDEVVKEFAGFDVVPASGGAIGPGDEGIVAFTPVPAPLGLAIREFFSLSVAAEQCCNELKGGGTDCNDPGNASTDPATACGQLQALFNQYAGPNMLSVTQLADLQRFRPFYVFTSGSPSSDVYPMRLSGFIEGVLPDGQLITSTQFNQTIGFCYGNCGAPAVVGNTTVEDCFAQ